MLLSRGCEYGLRAMIFVARHGAEEDAYVPIRRISDELGISYHFLTKVLQQLNEARLVDSFRGPRGGVRLAKKPDHISLREIVVALDGPALFRECVLGLPGCGDEAPCPLHAEWSRQREQLSSMLMSTTLAQTTRQIAADGLRIGP